MGTRHGVFHYENETLKIHSQAASYVCRATLDSLIYLAKCFPHHFVSHNVTEEVKGLSNFWDVLIRLENNKKESRDSSSSSKESIKKKELSSVDSGDGLGSSDEDKPISTLEQLNQTLFARLLKIIKHPVIRDNRSLIDKMLSLLGNTSMTHII